MTRTIPDHGTPTRYSGDRRGSRWTPCRCERCRAAHRRQRKIVELRVARGLGSRHAIEPVIAHIENLIKSGWTLDAIEKASGVDRRGMYRIRRRLQKSVNHDTARRLLALQPGGTPYLVDAVGARRRVQALAAIGWSLASQAEAVGLSHTAAEEIASGLRTSVMHSTHEAIRTLYQERSKKAGPSGWVRAFAARRGWHGPLAWDDIDDPGAKPESCDPYRPIPKGGRDDLRRQEIRHLLHCGESVASIASRMDRNEKYINDLISQGLGDGDLYEEAA